MSSTPQRSARQRKPKDEIQGILHDEQRELERALQESIRLTKKRRYSHAMPMIKSPSPSASNKSHDKLKFSSFTYKTLEGRQLNVAKKSTKKKVIKPQTYYIQDDDPAYVPSQIGKTNSLTTTLKPSLKRKSKPVITLDFSSEDEEYWNQTPSPLPRKPEEESSSDNIPVRLPKATQPPEKKLKVSFSDISFSDQSSELSSWSTSTTDNTLDECPDVAPVKPKVLPKKISLGGGKTTMKIKDTLSGKKKRSIKLLKAVKSSQKIFPPVGMEKCLEKTMNDGTKKQKIKSKLSSPKKQDKKKMISSVESFFSTSSSSDSFPSNIYILQSESNTTSKGSKKTPKKEPKVSKTGEKTAKSASSLTKTLNKVGKGKTAKPTQPITIMPKQYSITPTHNKKMKQQLYYKVSRSLDGRSLELTSHPIPTASPSMYPSTPTRPLIKTSLNGSCNGIQLDEHVDKVSEIGENGTTSQVSSDITIITSSDVGPSDVDDLARTPTKDIDKGLFQAQRKYAENQTPTNQSTDCDSSSLNNDIQSDVPSTEDFLLYLCLRTSSSIPDSLNIFDSPWTPQSHKSQSKLKNCDKRMTTKLSF